MRIPDEKIEEVRSANDIVDVIGGYVRLKKRGKNFLGLCPFHTEKTPSFAVSAEKQMYHCFGCGKGGNVFTFLMEHDKISFVEAVRSLAERVGIALPEGTSRDEVTAAETENLYAVCRFAGQHFHDNLTKTDDGRTGLEYFHKRGFDDSTIRKFGLGYALDAWDGLLQRARNEGLSPDDLLKAGLVRKREDGSLYDYFRGRAMFPVFSTTGRVIAFGARKLRDDDPLGKYINSPETAIYNKSRVLFGLFHAKDAIREADAALMVEGYADSVTVFQAGVENVVASSGTALTEYQLRLLARYSKNLLLVYDADSAGSNATLRGVDLALEQDFDVRVVRLPSGEDPDSFVRTRGGKEFRDLLSGAVSFIDFKARRFMDDGMLATPEGKTQAVRSIVQSIAKMQDELKRNFYIKEVSQKYDVYESVLYRELERWRNEERRTHADRTMNVESSTSPPQSVGAPPGREMLPGEQAVLKLLLEGNVEVIRYLQSHVEVSELNDERIRRIAQLVLATLEERGAVEVASILSQIEDDALKAVVTDVSMSRYELSKGWGEMEKEIDEPNPMDVARDAVRDIRKRRLQAAMEENQRALKEAGQRGADGMPYVRRQQELLRQLKEIDTPGYLR